MMKSPTGRRHTRQRQIILEEIKKLDTHPSAAMLFELVRKRLPKISLGTVYRNLDLLAETGVIQKLNTGSPEARFDWNPELHYHLRCTQCGRVEDVHDAPKVLVEQDAKTLQGFDILGHQLQFIGICPDCRLSGQQSKSQKIH
jgi:Fur family ferric uptake transcriptional regulator